VYIQVESYTHQLQTPSETASIGTPADNPDVITIGASEVKGHSFWSWSPHRYPDVPPYSSRGPTLGPGGTNPSSGIAKPNATAPTNTRTTRNAEFNGTSAAAAHATGMFAVMLSYDWSLTRTQLLSAVRATATSSSSTCNSTPAWCFGSGVLTLPAWWFQWGDLTREHTHHSVILSGIPESVTAAGNGRWVTINTASFPVSQRASGGTFVASRDRYAQVEFNFERVNGVEVSYYTMPGWAGCTMQVFRNGASVASVSLNGGSSYIRSLLTVNASTPGASTIVQLRSSGSCGVTLDAITPLIGEVLQETDSRITFAGPWSNASVVGASGGAFRTTSTTGASAYFTTTASDGFQIIYTARPDGGVAEVLINGQIVDEIDMYSPTQVPQSLHINGVWAGIKLVELRASGRRNAASRGQVITLDAVRFYSSMGSPVNVDLTAQALPNRPDYAADMAGAGVFLLPVNGSWSRVGSPAAFGGAFWSSNTPGAEILFQLDYPGTNRRLALFYTGTPTGGQVEVLLNGQVCSECGIIDTYRPVNMPRSVAVITLPNSAPTALTIGLRITGERHANSTGTSFIFEGVRIVQGALIGGFKRLPYSDVAMNWSTAVPETRVPWYANDIVPRALPGSIYGDVHAVPRPNFIYGTTAGFRASSDTVALIVARTPQAGQMLIEYYHSGGFYTPLQTVELNATTTRPREMIVLQKPASAFETGGLWFFRVSAQPGTSQTGSTGVFIFVDGALAFGNGFIGRDWATPGGDDLVYPTAQREEVGTGWGSAPATIAAPSRSAELFAPLRRTNAPGASFQFTYNPLVGDLELLYSRLPDGGIAEVYVDGQRFGEINFYSPTPLHFQIFFIPYDSSKTSAAVEIRNTNRRSPGSTGNWMYIDALSSVAGHVQLPYFTSLMTQQETSTSIQRIGAGWANLPAAPTGVVGPLGGAAQSVNQPGAVRFRMTGSSAWIVRTLVPNGGQAEVYVDGVRCTACGVVSFFNPTVSYRSPYRLTIPATYGAPPYVVELRALPTRPAGSSGTVMTLDAVVPVTGSITNVIYTEFEDINTSGGTFITVTLPSSPSGAQLAVDNDVVRTTGSTGCAYVSAPTANPQVTVYYTRQSSGGIAEIRTGPNPANLDTCITCGTINSFSPTTQYQVPHTFTAPVTAGQVIAVCQTGARQQGSTGFTLELDAVAFR
jgi:hypothetical protein